MNPAILFPYGCCPVCGLPGVRRDRGPDGNDRCEDGHTYPSRDAKPFAPSLDVAHAEAPDAEHCPCVPALRAEIERLREECHTLRLWAEGRAQEVKDFIAMVQERMEGNIRKVEQTNGTRPPQYAGFVMR